MIQFTVRTNSRFEMLDITRQVRDLLKENKIKSGICHVFIPHTTAAVTINENADPDVGRDISLWVSIGSSPSTATTGTEKGTPPHT